MGKRETRLLSAFSADSPLLWIRIDPDMAVLRKTPPVRNEKTGKVRPEGVPLKDAVSLRLMQAGREAMKRDVMKAMRVFAKMD